MTTSQGVKDYLQSQTSRLHRLQNEHVTGRTQQNVWATLMTIPDDFYNEVYPSIFLGDFNIAKKRDKLKAIGITHVLNCACGSSFNMINTDQKFFEKSGILFHGIAASDVRNFKLTPYFEAAADFIEEALSSGGKVYVHCMAGVSRSATIVLAFLVMKRNLHLMEAVKIVREKRKILPNDGFLKELVDLDNRLFPPGQS